MFILFIQVYVLEICFTLSPINQNVIILQDDYKNKEEIGILQCGHEYHADCIKRWLIQKNICPMCKSKALTIEQRGKLKSHNSYFISDQVVQVVKVKKLIVYDFDELVCLVTFSNWIIEHLS